MAEHDLTANLLYHNQIVLYGSVAWERFELEGRLLVDKHLPFEARYRFRDERVGQVCSAMGRLSAEYFKQMDDIRRNGADTAYDCVAGYQEGFNGEDVNLLLKDAFRAFCSAAEARNPHQFDRLQERYLLQLLSILS